MQEEKSYPFDLVGKNMGSTTESHLLCQLFFRAVIFPWEHISAMQITLGSVRAVSYLDMKDGKMEERGVKWGRAIKLPEELWWLKFTEHPLEQRWPSIHDPVSCLSLLHLKTTPLLSCLSSVSHIVYASAHICCLLIYGPDKTSTSVEVVLFCFSHRFSEAGCRFFRLS